MTTFYKLTGKGIMLAESIDRAFETLMKVDIDRDMIIENEMPTEYQTLCVIHEEFGGMEFGDGDLFKAMEEKDMDAKDSLSDLCNDGYLEETYTDND